MKSHVSGALAGAAMLVGCGGSALPPAPTGALPPSGQAYPDPAMAPGAPDPDAPPPPGPASYDAVGYAMPSGGSGNTHRSFAPGDVVEVTALDTGRTLLIAINEPNEGPGEIGLAPAVAQALGLQPGSRAAVRLRAASPSPVDRGALQSGRPFIERPDTPPILLTALRKKLGAPPAQTAKRPSPRPTVARPAPVAPADAPAARPNAGPGFYVQVAAFSDPVRAQSVARAVNGGVVAAGRINRVRMGPYRDAQSAQAARDAVAGRGYGDARIIRE